MKKKVTVIVAFALVLVMVSAVFAAAAKAAGDTGTVYASTRPTEAERKRVEAIYNSYVSDMSTFPFSVTIGDTVYNGFGKDFTLVSKSDPVKHPSKAYETTTFVFDHTSGLRFTLYLDNCIDNAAISWSMKVKNTSDVNSPIITDFYTFDYVFEGEDQFVYTLGGCGSSSYAPLEFPILKADRTFAETTGRSTESNWPYWNYMYGNQGIIIAVGWTGNWAADFIPNGTSTHFRAYQKALYAYLEPGEEIDAPMISTVYYDGRDYDRSVNVWRHYMIDCVMARNDKGELLAPAVSLYTGEFTSEMGTGTEKNQLKAIDNYTSNGVDFDIFWMDAFWHTDYQYWIADPKRFPTDIKAVSDRVEELGGKTLLWFAPETTNYTKATLPDEEVDGTKVDPDWIIEGYAINAGVCLMDMTNPDVLEFLKTRIIKAMERGGISIYREDINYLPGVDWTNIDKTAMSRKGIYENHYIRAHYDLWDALIEHFPGLWIDVCASGGTRLDVMSMSYSYPLHRIDYYGYFYDDCADLQAQTQSILLWIPYNGINTASIDNPCFDKYRMRSSMTPLSRLANDYTKKPDWDVARQWESEVRRTNEYVYDDYYALTPWSTAETDWCAYEYFSEEKGSGYALAFRRAKCGESTTLKFKGLDRNKSYVVTFEDAGYSVVKSGNDLINNGITVTVPNAEGSELIWIEEGNKATVNPITVTVNQSHNSDEKKKNSVIPMLNNENGFIRLSLHLSASLLDKSVEVGEKYIIELDEKYYDYFTVGGKKLSEISGARLEYDLKNNFIDFYIPQESGIKREEDFDIAVSGDLRSEHGIPFYGDYTFTWVAKSGDFTATVVPNVFEESSPLIWIIAGIAAAVAVVAVGVAAFVIVKKKKAK